MAWNQIVEWKAGDAGIGQRTPDLTPLVQAAVEQELWTRNSPLSFIVTGKGQRCAQTYDTHPDKAAKLVVEFRVPDVVTVTSSKIAASGE